MGAGCGGRAIRAYVALAAGLLWVTTTRRARAQDLDLIWQAPETCPSGDQVKSDFQRSLRLSPGYVPPHLSATAVVDHTGGRWFLHLHTVRNGIEGNREIEADSCSSLARAAALVLTLALGEGDFDQQPAPVIKEPAPAPSVQAPPPPPPAPPVAPVHAAHGPLTWSPTLEARAAWGPLPGPALGVGAGVDLRAKWWELSARGVAWPSVSQNPAPGVQDTFEGVGGALSFCVLGSPASFVVFALCGGLEASAIHGDSGGTRAGYGTVVPHPKLAPWYAALTSLRVRFPLFDSVHFELGFELAESLFRPEFAIGLGDAYVVPELSPSAVAGVSFDL
jgi:hypothetical protein